MREDKARLSDIEQLWTEATQQAAEMTARAEAAETIAATLRQEVASTAALLAERTAELEAVKRGSITLKLLDERFDRVEQIVADNAGPERESNGTSKRASRQAATKGAA